MIGRTLSKILEGIPGCEVLEKVALPLELRYHSYEGYEKKTWKDQFGPYCRQNLDTKRILAKIFESRRKFEIGKPYCYPLYTTTDFYSREKTVNAYVMKRSDNTVHVGLLN